MKKNLRKLNLSRETVRTLVDVPSGVVGGAKPQQTMTNCVHNTSCDYTMSCPGWCPVVD
ncbi:MAG TPA: hypothetical protein VHN15_08745 [Thermoanaerobaculia bacterium]|nr:hypothetical protein [Thermoanaerobaculia bacterium]